MILQLRNSLPRPADKLRWENPSRGGQIQLPSVLVCLTRAESLFLMQPRALLAFFTSRDIAGSCQSCCPPGPLILLFKDACESDSFWHVLVPGVFPPQKQDFILSLAKLHEVPDSLFLLPVEAPWDVSTTFWCTRHSSQFCTSSEPYAFPHPEPTVVWHCASGWANCSSEIFVSAAPARTEPSVWGAVGTKRPGQESGLFTIPEVKLQF